MKPDIYQQAVIDSNTNSVVSAGAGSGKTTVLALRFLRLVAEGRADVSEILTLTFTRKAAAEMYERIYRLMSSEPSNQRVADAAASFDKAVISTLDSFCSRIARDCCGMFGIAPGFVTDESLASELSGAAGLEFILSHREDRALTEFIYINGFEKVWHEYFEWLSSACFSIGNPLDFSDIFQKQMHTAENDLKTAVRRLSEFTANAAALEPVTESMKTAAASLPDMEIIAELTANADFSGLLKYLATVKTEKPRGASKKEEFVSFKEYVDEIRDFLSVISEITGMLDSRELIEKLFALTQEFQTQLFRKKRLSGILSFGDVQSIAVEGLKQDKNLRRYYKSLFRFIMIDEFQDNNSVQKDLLYLLAEKEGQEADGIPGTADLDPGKLFFVGDEKQSIYMFRGADVSVFKQLSSELAEAGGQALSLKRNYRSDPGLIGFFNKVFSNAMSESSEDYQAAFEALEPGLSPLDKAPDIRLLYKSWNQSPEEDDVHHDEAEAWSIAEYIKKTLGVLDVSEKGELRKAAYRDYAVLFRSGANQKTYEKVFRAMSIPYDVHSTRTLFQEAPVNDIYSFLQICLYPQDRAASAAVIRSPFMNLSDKSFISLMLSENPLFTEGNEDLCSSGDDLLKYRTAAPLYSEISSSLDRVPLADIVSSLWFKSGYRYILLANPEYSGYLEYFDYLRTLAAQADERSETAAVFLDYLRENLGEYRKVNDLNILKYSTGGVRMMPVHQSKGLEFPIVIIANSGNTGMNDTGSSMPACISDKYGLSFNLVAPDTSGKGRARCNYFYTLGKNERKAREEAELRRLFYVALTRAGNHLVISGCHGRQNRNSPASMLNIFLASAGMSYETVFDADQDLFTVEEIRDRKWFERTEAGAAKSPDDAMVISQYRQKAPLDFSRPKYQYSATGLNAELNTQAAYSDENMLSELGEPASSIIAESGLEAAFGTLCHRIIEYRIKKADYGSTELQPQFAGIDEKGWPAVYAEALRISDGFFVSDVWGAAGTALNIESELAFTLLTEHEGREITVNGIMDLVIELADRVIIVDFKTDRYCLPEEYSTQMKLYVRAARSIYSKPAECRLFYLRDAVEIVSA